VIGGGPHVVGVGLVDAAPSGSDQTAVAEKKRRQKLYKQFINEASKLYAGALVHDEAELSALVCTP